MALSRIQTAEIADNAVTTGKVDDATVIGTDIVDGTIVDSMVASGAAIAHTKCAVGPVASLNVGTGANQILQLNGSGVLPVLDGTQLTGIVANFTPIENQLARLGLHIGAVEQLAKFNMIDQVIDDYEDATGVTAYNGTSATAAIPAIPYSCRFTRASSDDMSKSSLSGGSTTKGTQSWWFKRASISSDQRMWANYSGSAAARNQVGWQATNKLYIQWQNQTTRISTQTFTSTTAWVHIVVAWDSTQATAADRLRVYIDGSEITAWDTNNAPTQNADMYLNNGKVYLGRRETSSLYLDAHMADFRSVDGQQLTPSTFGQTVSGVWKPKTVAGLTYGTNGFYLDFADSSALGNDVSGNNKDFTVANLTSGDRSTDTPQPTAADATPATPGTGSSSSATLAGSAGAKYYSGSSSTLSSLTDMSSANFTAGGGNISAWTWSGNDVTLVNASTEDGGTTDGAATPIIFSANTEFEVHFTPTTISSQYGPMVGIIPQTYAGDNDMGNVSGSSHTYSVTGSFSYEGGNSGAKGLRYNPSGTYSQVNTTNYNGTVCKFVRDASNYLKFYSAGTLIYTSTSTHSEAYEFLLSQQGGHTTKVVDLGYKIESSSYNNQTLLSTTTTAQSTATKASIVLQTEDATGTATINTDVKAGVSRDALNYVDTTLAKIGTWGSGNVYAANDVTMPGTVMTKDVTVRSSAGGNKFHIDEVSTTVAAVAGAWVTGDQSSLITVTANGIPLGGGTLSNLVDGLGGSTGDGQTTANGFYWSAQTPASGSYIRFAFSTAKAITEARWFTQNTTYQANWKWQGSNDASSWTDLNSSTAHTGVSVSYPTHAAYAINWSWANTTAYTYYQYTWVSGAYPQLWQQEVEFKYGATAASTTYSNQQPTLTATEGYTYKFDQSDSTNSGHPLRFSTTSNGTHASGTEYTTGVTTSGTPGSAGAYTQIVVAASAPTLYYYCSNHSGMGGTANTPAEAATTSMRYKIETKNQSYTAGSTTITDSSSSGHTVTSVADAALSTTQTKIGTHSIYCDGTDDEITVPDSDDWAFAGDYTVEFWVYFNGAPANNAHICGQGGNLAGNFAFMCRSEGSGNFIFGSSNGSTQRIITAGVNIASQWAHVALVKYGTAMKLYVNGTQAGSTITHADPIQNVSAPWEFSGGNNSASHMSAYWDEIRFSNVARYTANFTAFGQDGGTISSPTAFTSDSNTKLLIRGVTSAATGKITKIHGTSLAWK